jgi:hypothetical protein
VSRGCDYRLLFQAHWLWRVALFAALVILILDLEQLLQDRWMPSTAAALAVRQLLPSDRVAQALRSFEWARHTLPLATGGLIGAAGIAAFVPLPRRWVRWLRRTFA